MGRRLLLVALGAAWLGACRPDTVALTGRPEVGDTYRYRYEIDVVVTRRVEGAVPEATRSTTRLDVEQRVLDVDADGTLVALSLRAEGAGARQLEVRLDRAGSVATIESVEGLSPDVLGLAPVSALASAGTGSPPVEPVRIGDAWPVESDGRTGRARLLRLGMVDGVEGATVASVLTQDLDEVTTVAGSEVELTGRLGATTTAVFDLADGSVRTSSSHASGQVEALVRPPPGVEARPVPATITYDLRVHVTRLD